MSDVQKSKSERRAFRTDLANNAVHMHQCSNFQKAIRVAAAKVDRLTHDDPCAEHPTSVRNEILRSRIKIVKSIKKLRQDGVCCNGSSCRRPSLRPRKSERNFVTLDHLATIYANALANPFTTCAKTLEYAESTLKCAARHTYRRFAMTAILPRCNHRLICTHCSKRYQNRLSTRRRKVFTTGRKFTLLDLTLPPIEGAETIEAQYSLIRDAIRRIAENFSRRQAKMATHNHSSAYMEGFVVGIHWKRRKGNGYNFHLHILVASPAKVKPGNGSDFDELSEAIEKSWTRFAKKINASRLDQIANSTVITAKTNRERCSTISGSVDNTLNYLCKMLPLDTSLDDCIEVSRYLKRKQLVIGYGSMRTRNQKRKP